MENNIVSKNKYFKSRNNNRVTEPKAIEYLTKRKIRHVRFGLDALDSDAPIWKIPESLRAIPDYIVFSKYDQPYFFEAKGFVGKVKLKTRDLRNYKTWNEYLEIIMFLYNIPDDSYLQIQFNQIVKIIKEQKPEIKSYPESKNNTYYELPVNWLPDFKQMESLNEDK